jgi:hypothetical protein
MMRFGGLQCIIAIPLYIPVKKKIISIWNFEYQFKSRGKKIKKEELIATCEEEKTCNA